jgi:DNA repair protein RadC
MIIRERIKGNHLRNPAAVAAVIRSILQEESVIDQEKEHFWSIGLDTQHQINFIDLVVLGTLDTAVVQPREAFRLAIMRGCKSVIFVHNHPSGNIVPSKMDIEITRVLSDAGGVVGIQVLDHIIVGEDGHYSIETMSGKEDVSGDIKMGLKKCEESPVKVGWTVGTTLQNQRRDLRQFMDCISKYGDQTMVKFILIGIIQKLNPRHYKEALRGFVKIVVTSNNETEIECLASEVVGGYVNIQKEKSRTETLATLDKLIAEKEKKGGVIYGKEKTHSML